MELAIFLEKRYNGGGHFAEVLDESTVEVGKTEEDPDVIYRLGG